MDIDNFHLLVQFFNEIGQSMSPETCMTIQNSLIILQNDNHLQKIYYWGKILGLEEDYYIAFGFRKDIVKNRIYFYSKNKIDWYILQRPEKKTYYVSSICTTMLQGDPSLKIEVLDDAPNELIRESKDESSVQNIPEQEEGANDFENDLDEDDEGREVEDEETSKTATKVVSERMLDLYEEERLAAIVRRITREAAIVPRGAIHKRTDGIILPNPAFQGLTLSSCKDLSNYLHFRKPWQRWDKNLQYTAEHNFSTDFLDPIVDDFPIEGCWSHQITYRKECVIFQNLFWPGMTFIHVLGTPLHGFSYTGNGQKNLDLPFMIY